MSNDRKPSKGLKINNEKSTVATPVNATTDTFKKEAAEAAGRLDEYKKRSWDLGIKFKGIMESSVLVENKSILIKDLESETLVQLAQLANDINNDESQPEGTGSIALCQLIMKMLLLQKDMCSLQKFRIEQLEKQAIVFRDRLDELEHKSE